MVLSGAERGEESGARERLEPDVVARRRDYLTQSRTSCHLPTPTSDLEYRAPTRHVCSKLNKKKKFSQKSHNYCLFKGLSLQKMKPIII